MRTSGEGAKETPLVAREADRARRPWKRPVITRIDMKRTMAGLGPYTDTGAAKSI